MATLPTKGRIRWASGQRCRSATLPSQAAVAEVHALAGPRLAAPIQILDDEQVQRKTGRELGGGLHHPFTRAAERPGTAH